MKTRDLSVIKKNLGNIEEFICSRYGTENSVIVLEIGCGVGNSLRDLAVRYPKISFYGMNRKIIAEQVVKDNIHYLYGDAGVHIPLPDNSVDFAYSICTIQFIEDKVGFVNEVFRVLKPEGQFWHRSNDALVEIDGQSIFTVSDDNRTIGFGEYMLGLKNPNISFCRHSDKPFDSLEGLTNSVIRITKKTDRLVLNLDKDFEVDNLDLKYPHLEGYKSSHYRLLKGYCLKQPKPKVLVIAASPHGYGHLYRGEMICDYLEKHDYNVAYLSNSSVRLTNVSVLLFSDLGINMKSKKLDDESRRRLSEYVESGGFEFVIIDHFPLGKLFLLDGFKTLVAACRCDTKFICVYRDIMSIDELSELNESVSVLNTYFSKLLVFSDSKVLKLPTLLTDKVTIPIKYLGFLDSGYIPQITIFGGGGKYNYEFYAKTLNVILSQKLNERYTIKLFTGMNLSAEEYSELTKQFGSVQISRHCDSLQLEIYNSDITISTFGYNTYMQLMRSNNYNIIVPLPKNHQEQYTRAQKFQSQKDKVSIILLDPIYEQSLAEQLRQCISHTIDRNGLQNMENELNSTSQNID